MVISKKTAFLLINFLMVVGIMFSVTDSFLADFGVKFKYVFILYCLTDIFSHRKKPCSLNLAVMFSLLAFYVLAWGFLFKNPIVAAQIADHRKTMLIYLAVLIPCTLEVIHYRCAEEYAVSSGAALILVLLIQIATHRSDFIFNPVFAVRSFLSHELHRSTFGFLDPNFVGNSCFLAGSVFYMVYLFGSGNSLLHSRIKMLMVLTGILVIYILLCTGSRTPAICLASFCGCALIIRLSERVRFSYESKDVLRKIMAVGIFLLMLLLYATDFWEKFWTSSNRDLNVSVNLPLVPLIGNIWTGMGFVENGVFITNASNNWISAFGVQTSSLDMNYLYIYCTTGILGCAVMAAILILLGIGLWKNRRQKYGAYFFALFIIILFYAIMETVLFTYRFWAMMIPYVLLFYGANMENGK